MSSHTTRWNFEAHIEPSDKVRLRGFIRNEIAYYNALLNAFGSRLRTMPEIFSDVDAKLLGEIAAHGYNVRALSPDSELPGIQAVKSILFKEDGTSALDERTLLFLESVSVTAVLHPETRRAMAMAMLAEHARQADALAQTIKRDDQVLARAVELLHPHDGRLKRHVQIPARAVAVSEDGRSIRSAYTAAPIRLKQAIPDNIRYNVVVIRDEDANGVSGEWNVELRQEPTDYLVRLSDAPIKKKRMNLGQKRHSNV